MNLDLPSPSARILRLAQVIDLTGYKRASIYAKTCTHSTQYDPSFPQRVRLNSSGRGAVGWFESEIYKWLQLRADARPNNAQTLHE